MDAMSHSSSFVQNNIQNRRQMFRRLRAKAIAKQSSVEKFAIHIVREVGTTQFLLINFYTLVIWIVLQFIPGIHHFDPYPFILLITVISIEDILLTIFILISQHQTERLESLREQINLQFDIITEEELTKVLQLMAMIAEKNDIAVSEDDLLQEMIKPIDLEKIEKALEEQIEGQ